MKSPFCKTLENVPLAKYSSMKTGGSAKFLCLPESVSELADTVLFYAENDIKCIVMGNMSNVLVPDEGIDVPVVLTGGVKEYSVLSQDKDGAKIFADCGISVTALALEMCKSGFSGLEFAYGIPGSLGGAVYMNAGAYGGEMSNVTESVYVLTKEHKIIQRPALECNFSYRNSVFETNGDIILGAVLKLGIGDKDECVSAAKELMKKRIEKQPLDFPSCGSTFKRPEGYFAGKLIEDAGLKGFSVGGAAVSDKHAGFVINKNNASTSDVIALMRKIQNIVKQNSGVTLESEIRIIDKNGENTEL